MDPAHQWQAWAQAPDFVAWSHLQQADQHPLQAQQQQPSPSCSSQGTSRQGLAPHHVAGAAAPQQPEQQHHAYESRYGPTNKCSEGECEAEPAAPCKEHRCACCKLHRQVAASSRQGLCGPCTKREVVCGLSFVRCGRCKAEMLESTYQAHLKQNVVVVDPATGQRVAGRCRDFPKEVRERGLGLRMLVPAP